MVQELLVLRDLLVREPRVRQDQRVQLVALAELVLPLVPQDRQVVLVEQELPAQREVRVELVQPDPQVPLVVLAELALLLGLLDQQDRQV